MALDAETLMKHLAEDHYVETDEIDGDTPLFTSGLINSFAMIDMMEFIESALGRRMPPQDFTVPNMDTVNKILAYVEAQSS